MANSEQRLFFFRLNVLTGVKLKKEMLVLVLN